MDENREFVAEGELSSVPEPKKKKKRWWVLLIDVLAVSVFTVTVLVSINVIHLSVAYNLPFFVNGMSMYPTFNKDGLSASGKSFSWNSGNNYPGDLVDYGYAKAEDKDNWRASLQRYDVVVVYYPEDYQKDSYGNYIRDASGKLVLRTGAKSKIKRLVGMPGETIRFEGVTEDTLLYNRYWGKTTLNPGTEYEIIVPPLYGPADFPPIPGHTYNYPVGGHTWNLAWDEYVVLGDNRGYSNDCYSRSNPEASFALKAEMVIGKACLVVGQKRLNDAGEPDDSWWYVFTPWNYREVH